jgi:dTDP-4-dehydrorhamnose 3,5-epimerase
MRLSETPIAGLYEAESLPVGDSRGRFARLFCADALAPAQRGRAIVQINHSYTQKAGTVRGLHFQHPPAAEGKWIRCLKGCVFDVGVDLRRGSPTFLGHHAVTLDADRFNALFVPEGCAHGFQALSDSCELLYLHTAAYAPELEGGFAHDDPRIGIDWPMPAACISDRDRALPAVPTDFEGLPC